MNATGIIPFAIIEGVGTVEISLGTNKTLPYNATIYLDDDTIVNEDDSSMVIIRGNNNNEAGITGNNTICKVFKEPDFIKSKFKRFICKKKDTSR